MKMTEAICWRPVIRRPSSRLRYLARAQVINEAGIKKIGDTTRSAAKPPAETIRATRIAPAAIVVTAVANSRVVIDCPGSGRFRNRDQMYSTTGTGKGRK